MCALCNQRKCNAEDSGILPLQASKTYLPTTINFLLCNFRFKNKATKVEQKKPMVPLLMI